MWHSLVQGKGTTLGFGLQTSESTICSCEGGSSILLGTTGPRWCSYPLSCESLRNKEPPAFIEYHCTCSRPDMSFRSAISRITHMTSYVYIYKAIGDRRRPLSSKRPNPLAPTLFSAGNLQPTKLSAEFSGIVGLNVLPAWNSGA